MDCPKSSFGRRILRTTPSLLLWRALIVFSRNLSALTKFWARISARMTPGCPTLGEITFSFGEKRFTLGES